MTEHSAAHGVRSAGTKSDGSPATRARIFKGTRLLPAIVPSKFGSASAYSFFISNRTLPTNPEDTAPIPNGAINWYTSTTQANDPNPEHYTAAASEPSATVPPAFLANVIAALNAQTNPNLTIFIHGLGNLFDDAIVGSAAFGANLSSFASYPGLLIGFDWPSYDEDDSAYYYAPAEYAFPLPTSDTSGTIRSNINGTANVNVLSVPTAFANLVTFVGSVANGVNNKSAFTANLVCHSEGNYLGMLGFYQNTEENFSNILLLAADINEGALQATDSETGLIGQAIGLGNAAGTVTVYYTTADDILPASVAEYSGLTGGVHNPMFGGRLGISGPNYNAGSQATNMYSVDCSAVINVQNVSFLQQEDIVPVDITSGGVTYALSLHSSYFYIPQVLQDMADVLTGSQQSEIANRSSTADSQGYAMIVNNNNNAAG